MKKRAISAVIAMCLMLTAVCAAEGGTLTLVNAAEKLAFETKNVTLNAQAKFYYDGEWFKTFTGLYKQDGANSAMVVTLDTPRENGEVYTGGYTVVGNGTDVYYSETYNGSYYLETVGTWCDTVLRETPLRRAFMGMAQGAASVLNDAMAEDVAYEDGVVAVKMNGAPALVNSALTYAATQYIERNYGYIPYTDTVSLIYDDYESLAIACYERERGEKIEEDMIGRIYRGEATEEDWNVYNEIYLSAANMIDSVTANYKGGTLWFRNDGTYEWFETNDEYLRAANFDYLYYEDYNATLRGWYEKKYGKALSQQTLDMIMYSTNEELWADYYELVNELDEYYKEVAAQNPETVGINVLADGSYEELTTVETSNRWTVTRRIVAQMKEMALGNVDAAFEISEAGDAVSGKGVAEFIVTDREGEKHSLTVEFDCTADDYGSTHVGAFNPEEYGLVSFQDYVNATGGVAEEPIYIEPDPSTFPDTIEFGSKTYELFPEAEFAFGA